MEPKQPHSPTPWRAEPQMRTGLSWLHRSQMCVGRVHSDRAEFIVRACNAHDAMVEALNQSDALLRGILCTSADSDTSGAINAQCARNDTSLALAKGA